MKNSVKYVFFGTGDFATKVLEVLCQNDFVPELVVTTPDKPKGRKMILTPSPVKIFADKNNIKTITDYSLLTTDYSLFTVADFGRIIPKNILNMPKHGTLNIHPSLLPKFRGSSPIQSFILSGEEETGVTIIKIDEEVDHGPILAQQEFSISNFQFSKYKELEKKLAELGGEMLAKIIPDWIEGKIMACEQNHSQATFTKKITKEDGLIDLGEPAEIIARKVRAFTPWPGAYFFANNKRIIITDAEEKNEELKIKKVKPEGKNEMVFADFLKGNKSTKLEKYLETA
jgi:methionyl-tRNA formyltransferase